MLNKITNNLLKYNNYSKNLENNTNIITDLINNYKY